MIRGYGQQRIREVANFKIHQKIKELKSISKGEVSKPKTGKDEKNNEDKIWINDASTESMLTRGQDRTTEIQQAFAPVLQKLDKIVIKREMRSIATSTDDESLIDFSLMHLKFREDIGLVELSLSQLRLGPTFVSNHGVLGSNLSDFLRLGFYTLVIVGMGNNCIA